LQAPHLRGRYHTKESSVNTETATLYRTPEEIAAARARGEPLAEISEEAARVVEAGHDALKRESGAQRKKRLRAKSELAEQAPVKRGRR
jgi:hypothetical protein